MPLTVFLPDAPPFSSGVDDDEFADISGGLPGGWTEVDFGGTQTVVEDEAGVTLTQSTHAGSGLSGIYKAIPAGDFTVWTKVSFSTPYSSAIGLHWVVGLALWEDATNSAGDIKVYGLSHHSSDMNDAILTYTAYNVAPAESGPELMDAWPSHFWIRVRRTGTTYAFDSSTNGVGWQRIITGTITFTPTHYGLAVDSINAGVDVAARFSFFRYLNSDVGHTALMLGDRIVLSIV